MVYCNMQHVLPALLQPLLSADGSEFTIDAQPNAQGEGMGTPDGALAQANVRFHEYLIHADLTQLLWCFKCC
jgi:hypothetical protein